jgi:hypothetical protein
LGLDIVCADNSISNMFEDMAAGGQVMDDQCVDGECNPVFHVMDVGHTVACVPSGAGWA